MDLYIPQTPEQIADQAKLTITTFGLSALDVEIYKSSISKLVEKESKEENRNTGSQSNLGSPVFSNLILKARTYKNNDLKDVTTFQDDIILDCVLFDVAQSKTIITTPIQGFNGTVKEFISDGDYTLNIKGVINGTKNGVYPLTQAKNLFEGLKANIEIEVVSWYLNELFGITHIVITDFQLNQLQGNQTAVSYEIQAISDKPIELYLTKK